MYFWPYKTFERGPLSTMPEILGLKEKERKRV
jgi:hypothetical protein